MRGTRTAELSHELRLAFTELAGVAREELLAMSVSVDLRVIAEMMEEELTSKVGPKHAKNPGTGCDSPCGTPGSVVLGGRRVKVQRPRARTTDNTAVHLGTYATFAAPPSWWSRTEAKLLALERRVRDGELVAAAKIGRAAQRILGASRVARPFDVEIAKGRFLYHYDEAAFVYEYLLAGRYVLATSLTPDRATAAQVVMAYPSLLEIERRFRVLKDFLHLRPIRHWTERRVRAHVAVSP